MINSTKEQIGRDVICKSHLAKTDRDLYRICPSKLSKRELEDLYFALLENNLELKKTVNAQQEKLKVLTTKLQRMTAGQKNVAGKEKDCCASKGLVDEQKESITDLKKTNERMAERIRVLNMRLCSAKQFLKRSPSQTTNSNKNSTRSLKNSISALNGKQSDPNVRSTAVFCQYSAKDLPDKETRTVETETEILPEKEVTERTCNENKCSTTMDELKEKINNLQQELSLSQESYSQRIASLETQVSSLRADNLRVRSERAASEQRARDADLLRGRLRAQGAVCNELNMELAIEKRKVTELETGLKLANLSNHVVDTIEQLAAAKEEKRESNPESNNHRSLCSESSQKNVDFKTSPNVSLELPSPTKPYDEVKISKSDDSGYTELNKSCETDDNQTMVKINRELLEKIADLQTQLDVLRISAAGENVEFKQNAMELEPNENDSKQKVKDFESYDVETKDVEDENPIKTSEDSGSVMMSMEHIQEKSNPISQTTVKQRDASTEPNRYETEAVKGNQSNLWHNLFVPRTEENAEQSVNNVNIDQSATSEVAIKNKTDAKNSRDDTHNSFQIPGPIPIVPASSTEKPKICRKTSRDSYTERNKRKPNSEEKTVKIFEDKDNECFRRSKENGSATFKPKDLVTSAKLKEHEKNLENDRRRDYLEKKLKKVSITDEEAKLAGRTPVRDSIFVNRRVLSAASMNVDDPAMAEVKKESITSFYLDSVCTPPKSQSLGVTASQTEDNIEMYALCESRARICRCPVLEKRDVAVFRSCSGTLRFRTTAASERLRRCACQVQTEYFETDQPSTPTHRNSTPTQSTSTPTHRNSATYTADVPNTFTVKVEKRSRATSPDNTDHEISSLSDLPSEKNAKAPVTAYGTSRADLSPGEDRATMTYTDEETLPTDYGSLSEGELPLGEKGRRLSLGEKASVMNRSPTPPPRSSSEKMEATLQSISEELARCRQLLLSQRPQETRLMEKEYDVYIKPVLYVVSNYLQYANGAGGARPEGHALRHGLARRSIGGHPPSCVFVLHIGTMVLCDEAVLNHRDKTLVLLWKFYSQHVAMTRVRCGRVIQFDFVTEYDVTFNEDFLDYMKHCDLEIWLCEQDKQDEPFAICMLPLREALLHANRRADMSLALIPTTALEGTSTKVGAGEEIGILDLWCNLRADVALLPTIHRAMHTPSPPTWENVNSLRSDSKVMQQAVDDELSRSSERLSRDLELSLNAGSKHTSQSKAPELLSQKFATPNEEYQPVGRKASSRYDVDIEQYRSSLPPYRRLSSQIPKINPASDQMRHESSGVIINAVPASIKSTDEMKKALERNVQQNNSLRLFKMDDDAYLRHSSIASVKSLAARHQLSKLRWSKKKTSKDNVDSFQNLLRKRDKDYMHSLGSVQTGVSMEGYIPDNSYRNLSKVNNVNKYIGVPGINKIVEASKKSVKYTDVPFQEEPQKEISADSEDSADSIDITVLWLSLNEDCEAMANTKIKRLYVAYTFLGRRGAEMETPFSLPKPKHYADKCYFNFKKTFHLLECDLPLLGHMSRCRAGGGASTDPRDCIVFTLVSEPSEDPLGLSSCEDVGYAYLYLGDVLAYSGDSAGYTEVVGVRGVRGGVCGVLAVRLDRLPVLRRCLSLSHSHRDLSRDN